MKRAHELPGTTFSNVIRRSFDLLLCTALWQDVVAQPLGHLVRIDYGTFSKASELADLRSLVLDRSIECTVLKILVEGLD